MEISWGILRTYKFKISGKIQIPTRFSGEISREIPDGTQVVFVHNSNILGEISHKI